MAMRATNTLLKQIAVAVLLSAIYSIASADDWVDAWVAQSTRTPAGSFQGQQRDYFTGGGYSARWRTSNVNPISINPPRIKAGCGGIDIFMGGASFVDPEYLVSKFQSLLQAAPAVAFDLALKNMCRDCSDTMKAIDAAVQYLNGLQINDCAIAKRAVVAASDKIDGNVMSEVWGEISAGQSLNDMINKNYQQNQEQTRASGGKSQSQTNQLVNGCSAEFKTVFSNGGSVVENLTTMVGMGAYANTIRGYIGDVQITYSADAGLYSAETLPRCTQNTGVGADDFLEGTAMARRSKPNGGDCFQDSATKLTDYVSNQLIGIATKIAAGNAAFTADEQALIDVSNIPVYTTMKSAVEGGNVNASIMSIRDPIMYMMAYRILDDLYITIEKAMVLADLAADQKARADCRTNLLKDAIDAVKVWRADIRDLRKVAKQAHNNSMQELNASIQYAQEVRRLRSEQSVRNARMVRQ